MIESQTTQCASCQAEFTIGSEEQAFIATIAPEVGGQRIEIPLPTRCPRCRQQRRLLWRNDRTLYRRTCDKTGKAIISQFSPDKPFPVYDNDVWWSDAWDPLEYGRDVDLNRSILEQIADLQKVVPRSATNKFDAEGSDYVHNVWHIKGSYLCFNVGYAEDSYYCSECYYVTDLVDCLLTYHSERSYELLHASKSSNSRYLEESSRCSNAYFSYDCRNCNDIVLCTNLRNKQYCIRNVQYSKEEYLTKLAEFNFGSRKAVEQLQTEYAALRARAIHGTVAE